MVQVLTIYILIVRKPHLDLCFDIHGGEKQAFNYLYQEEPTLQPCNLPQFSKNLKVYLFKQYLKESLHMKLD